MPYCPECHNEIDHLNYESTYTESGWENGTCDCNGENWNCDDRSGDDYSNDGETNYMCPECEHHIDPDELLDNLDGNECEEDFSDSFEVDGDGSELMENNIIDGGRNVINPISQRYPEPKQRLSRGFECPECHQINFRDLNEACFCSNCNHEIET